jgi:hypothetical protein
MILSRYIREEESAKNLVLQLEAAPVRGKEEEDGHLLYNICQCYYIRSKIVTESPHMTFRIFIIATPDLGVRLAH